MSKDLVRTVAKVEVPPRKRKVNLADDVMKEIATRSKKDSWAAINKLSDHDEIIATVDRREHEAGIEGLGACVELFRQLGEGCVWGTIECVGRIETRYADNSLDKFCEAHALPIHTAYRYRRIYRAFPVVNRILMLSVAHHYVAATTDEPQEWLERAHRKNWSVREMLGAVAQTTAKELPESSENDGDVSGNNVAKIAESVFTLDEAEQTIRAIVRGLVRLGEFNRRVLQRFAKAMAEESLR